MSVSLVPPFSSFFRHAPADDCCTYKETKGQKQREMNKVGRARSSVCACLLPSGESLHIRDERRTNSGAMSLPFHSSMSPSPISQSVASERRNVVFLVVFRCQDSFNCVEAKHTQTESNLINGGQV